MPKGGDICPKPLIDPSGLNYKEKLTSKERLRIGRMTAIKIDVGDGGRGKKDPGGKVSSSAVAAGGLRKQPGLTTTYEIVFSLASGCSHVH